MFENTYISGAENSYIIPTIVVAVFGVIIALIQLAFNIKRDNRDDRHKKSTLGYNLVDELFGDKDAKIIFDLIDSKLQLYIKIEGKPYATNMDDLKKAIESYLKNIEHSEQVQKRNEVILYNLDCVLYHLNRFEHALRSELTSIEALSQPIKYYIDIFKDDQEFFNLLKEYCSEIGYELAKQFLENRALASI